MARKIGPNMLISEVSAALDPPIPEATLRSWRHRGVDVEKGLEVLKGKNGKLYCRRKDVERFKKTWPWG